ncbi:cytochrome P450 [Irpex lacteus]|nr:cytochrome P450 [Irpex lacteus]
MMAIDRDKAGEEAFLTMPTCLCASCAAIAWRPVRLHTTSFNVSTSAILNVLVYGGTCNSEGLSRDRALYCPHLGQEYLAASWPRYARFMEAVVLCALVARHISRKRHSLPLPPGPPADPLIGHLRAFPEPHNTAEVLHDWSLKYGDVISLRVPGKTIIVLASEKAASDLLEKRSAIYSDRARLGYYDQVGWGDSVIFASYGPFHTRQRKMYNDALGKNIVSEYRAVQEREANVLLKGLLDEPGKFDRHAARFAGGVVTDIGYGHRIESYDDEFFSVGERFIKYGAAATTPTLLDIHPIFASLPSWAPGAWFKEGTAKPSFVSRLLEDTYGGQQDPEQERALRLAAGMIFADGSLLHHLGFPIDSWSMTWDESKFHDPQQFKPERYLPKPEGAGETFPTNAVFGWGRRICAGRFLAEGSLWTAAARILAVFSISPMKDEKGKDIKTEVKFKTILTRKCRIDPMQTSHTEPYTCNILPRDEVALRHICSVSYDTLTRTGDSFGSFLRDSEILSALAAGLALLGSHDEYDVRT